MTINTDVLEFVKSSRVCRYSTHNGSKDDPSQWARLSYGDLKTLDHGEAFQPTDFLMPELLSGSDYCFSGSVEVSNHRVFLERYGKLPNVYDVYGDYGTFAVAIRLDSITPEMLEDFQALEDYPCLDDEDVSEVERESEEESWESFVRSNFRDALVKQFDSLEDEINNLSDDQLSTIFYKLCDRTNTYWEHESGNNAFIRIERVIKGATEQDIREAKEAL